MRLLILLPACNCGSEFAWTGQSGQYLWLGETKGTLWKFGDLLNPRLTVMYQCFIDLVEPHSVIGVEVVDPILALVHVKPDSSVLRRGRHSGDRCRWGLKLKPNNRSSMPSRYAQPLCGQEHRLIPVFSFKTEKSRICII